MSAWVARVGLEVHVRLATGRRLLTSTSVGDGTLPNTSVDAFVLAEPGTLPVLDPHAVELAGRAAVALGASVAQSSGFDRKHYVYPDLPRGYQVTQQATPFASGGVIDAPDGPRCRIERLHLEDDAGRSVQVDGAHCVDLDRAGGALVEIVTAPELQSGAEAEAVLRELRAVLVAAGVTRGALETGDLRCDANVSVGAAALAAGDVERVELKNLNSFRHVRLAVDAELERQRAAREAGRAVVAETRRWTGEATAPTRAKRAHAAYGWLPEPDLPAVRVSDDDVARWRRELPELPAAARARLVDDALSGAHAVDLVAAPELLRMYDAAREGADRSALVRWLLGTFAAARNRGLLAADAGVLRCGNGDAVPVSWLVAFCELERDGVYTAAQLETIADACFERGTDPAATASALGIGRAWNNDDARAVVTTVVAAHPTEAARYRGGKAELFGFFMGKVRGASDGAIDPALARTLLEDTLRDPDAGGEA